jgi:4-alpha-glucanotransferase
MSGIDPRLRPCVTRALRVLGVDRLVFGIHDSCFPSAPSEDLGRGSPYTRGGRELVELVGALGFTGIQLGPQGQTSPGNPSPYDGTIFSRSELSIALAPLAEGDPRWPGLLTRHDLDELVSRASPRSRTRTRHAQAHALAHEAVDRAWAAARKLAAEHAAPVLAQTLTAFRRANAWWLERDALYAALSAASGGADWARWSSRTDRELWRPRPGHEAAHAARRASAMSAHAEHVARTVFGQFLAHEQHREFLDDLRRRHLTVYGDLQIGWSRQDAWACSALLLEGYAMGAPPSRTNPEGQPWGYPVFDPAHYWAPDGAPGPVVALFAARIGKMLAEYDGVRIDHPHGLVCPWVYDSTHPDPRWAVQHGARLFESPDLADHPRLAAFAIARSDQIDRAAPRHADRWVRRLDRRQVRRYGMLFDVVVEGARHHGVDRGDVVCEVLSTLPVPLAEVLRAHGLGRFRVTQKADMGRRDDVYRSDNARENDWIMVGNHDTPPIWRLVSEWAAEGKAAGRARYLAERLVPERGARAAFAARLEADPQELAMASFADLFASRARNVYIWFSDLFGLTDIYNRPGTVDDENWTLRLAPSFRTDYLDRIGRGAALDVPRALAMALRATPGPAPPEHAPLIAELSALSPRGAGNRGEPGARASRRGGGARGRVA